MLVAGVDAQRHQDKLDHTGQQGGQRRALDAQLWHAELAEDEQVVEHQIDAQRQGVDEGRHFQAVDGPRVKADGKGHRGEEVGERHNPQIAAAQIDDVLLPGKQGEDLRGKQQRSQREKHRDDDPQHDVDAEGAADVFDVPHPPVLGNIDRSAAVDAEIDGGEDEVDAVSRAHRRQLIDAQLADHDRVGHIQADADQVLQHDRDCQGEHGSPKLLVTVFVLQLIPSFQKNLLCSKRGGTEGMLPSSGS